MDCEILIKNLKKRGFDTYFCENREEALRTAISLIDKDGTIGFGGSVTIEETGLLKALRENNYKLIDRDSAKTPDERVDIMRKALTADTYLMSTNAISKDGILVNIDGNGNRVAALCYGPKTVIMIVGINKVCETVSDAEYRARNTAAVKNAKRLNRTTTGCVSGKCLDCLSDECICSHMVKTRRSAPSGRIKVILVNEELGF